MLVVADSSPFIVLINIGRIDILPHLFGMVIVPPEVSGELREDKRPQAVRTFIAAPPAWLIEQAPKSVEPIERVGIKRLPRRCTCTRLDIKNNKGYWRSRS